MTVPDDTGQDIADIPLDDPISQYLREIGSTALLSAAEEVALAERIVSGREAAARLAAGDRGPHLAAQVADGDTARQHLIQANLRLVVSIAKKYTAYGLTMMDLVQEGNIGLMRAVEKFDHTKGNRFSTYTTWWIRQAVTRALMEKGRAIRLPVHVGDTRLEIRRTVNQLCMDLAHEPTPEEIAGAMGVSVEKVQNTLLWGRDTASLNSLVGEDRYTGESTELGDLIPAQGVDTEAAAFHAHVRGELARAMAGLTDRERRILELRCGWHDDRPRTLDEIGRALGMTRERARQIEAEAKRKLRHPHLGAGLREFVGEL